MAKCDCAGDVAVWGVRVDGGGGGDEGRAQIGTGLWALVFVPLGDLLGVSWKGKAQMAYFDVSSHTCYVTASRGFELSSSIMSL